MLAGHVALLSQTSRVRLDQLAIAAAAIQKQITRDFGPIWQISADVAVFGELSDVPLGYWPVIIRDDIRIDAQGIHLTKNGQPFALVLFSDNWTLTTSHECLEMLADPSGNRVQAGNSVMKGQGPVEFLVEVCNPSEAVHFAYSVNGVLVSDFCTPNFFDPFARSGMRYSFTGAITEPYQVLEGGCLSWMEPGTSHLFQLLVAERQSHIIDRGPLPVDLGNLRSFSNRHSAQHRMRAVSGAVPKSLLLTRLIPNVAGYDASSSSAATLDQAHAANAKMIERSIGGFAVANAWVEDADGPLILNRTYKFCVNVGKLRTDALASAPLPRIDWRNQQELKILVVLGGGDFRVSPPQQPLTLSKSCDTKPVEFEIMPLVAESALLRISFYLARELLLLEEFEISVQVEHPAKVA
jgi:hypothetical protein